MTTRSFIRTVWGEYAEKIDDNFISNLRESILGYYSSFVSTEEAERYIVDNLNILKSNRLSKIDDNIGRAINEKIKFPFVCYTFGEENHKRMISLGINSILANKFPNPFYLYRHKLEALKLGMRDFDEVVFLDWDTKPIKEIDEDFWRLLGQKDVFQASLSRYSGARLSHRNGRDNKWCSSGQFVYCRDKSLPDRIIELWKKEKHRWVDEVGWARIADELMGEWSIEEYYRRFEPIVFTTSRYKYRTDEKIPYFTNRGHPYRY